MKKFSEHHTLDSLWGIQEIDILQSLKIQFEQCSPIGSIPPELHQEFIAYLNQIQEDGLVTLNVFQKRMNALPDSFLLHSDFIAQCTFLHQIQDWLFKKALKHETAQFRGRYSNPDISQSVWTPLLEKIPTFPNWETYGKPFLICCDSSPMDVKLHFVKIFLRHETLLKNPDFREAIVQMIQQGYKKDSESSFWIFDWRKWIQEQKLPPKDAKNSLILFSILKTPLSNAALQLFTHTEGRNYIFSELKIYQNYLNGDYELLEKATQKLTDTEAMVVRHEPLESNFGIHLYNFYVKNHKNISDDLLWFDLTLKSESFAAGNTTKKRIESIIQSKIDHNEKPELIAIAIAKCPTLCCKHVEWLNWMAPEQIAHELYKSFSEFSCIKSIKDKITHDPIRVEACAHYISEYFNKEPNGSLHMVTDINEKLMGTRKAILQYGTKYPVLFSKIHNWKTVIDLENDVEFWERCINPHLVSFAPEAAWGHYPFVKKVAEMIAHRNIEIQSPGIPNQVRIFFQTYAGMDPNGIQRILEQKYLQHQGNLMNRGQPTLMKRRM